MANESFCPPLVSIGFPVYNGERYIREALDSLLAQDYSNFQIIISDNASTDNTVPICQEYVKKDSRITLCKNEHNLGAAVNFIKVLEMSIGHYFMWAAHDDRWEPSFISSCVKQLEDHPDAVMSFCKVAFIDPAGNKVVDDNYNEVATYGMDLRARVKCMVSKMNWYAIYGVFRREVLLNKKLYTAYGSDVLYLMQCTIDGSFIMVPEPLFIYRLRAKTYTDDLNTLGNGQNKKPHTQTPLTELARNMIGIIAQSTLSLEHKTILQADLCTMFAFHNITWRNVILSENPFMQTAIEMGDSQVQTMTSLLSLFSSLLLNGNNLDDTIVSTDEVASLQNGKDSGSPVKLLSNKNNGTMRILFQNRAGIKQQPGGDSVIMDHLKTNLESLGVVVDVNADPCCDLSHYDCVHLYNLTLQDLTNQFAKNAVSQNIPFVVTSLQEDFPLYINKSAAYVHLFQMYIQSGQNKNVWEQGRQMIETNPPEPALLPTALFAIEHAQRILTCGDNETKFIQSKFPKALCQTAFFGSSIIESSVGPELFINQFGVKDFVLCVGRLEMRKNQLMLMKAFEDDDTVIVFADGGFTYQPSYVDLCKQYKRKGKTIFTGRLSSELLVSAYRAAAVHCLPSWYELPGLVTLEAARYGSKIVASSWGAIENYMEDTITYCVPNDPVHIKQAVLTEMQTDRNKSAMHKAAGFTWEKSAVNVKAIYENVIANYVKKSDKIECKSGNTPVSLIDLLQNVARLVEENKNVEALKLYDRYRPNYPPQPDLVQFDELVEVVRKKVHCAHMR